MVKPEVVVVGGSGSTAVPIQSALLGPGRVPVVPFVSRVHVTGVLYDRRHFTVLLEDGRVLSEESGEVLRIGRSSVTLRNGEILYYLTGRVDSPPRPTREPLGARGVPRGPRSGP